jgi:hypothetical protein
MSSTAGSEPRFSPGSIVITSNALGKLPGEDVRRALGRHLRGDWGNLDAEDLAENERALRDGHRLFSSYRASTGDRFWIITEWDRSLTTVLLPEDY